MEKEKLLLAKVSDKIKKYKKEGEIIFTSFLDPAEQIEVASLLRDIPYHFWGGYAEAERKIAVIGSTEEHEEVLSAISIISTKALTHREVLGSVLGLGITREKVGDILVNGEICDIIVQKDLSEFILNHLTQVGREKVSVSEKNIENLISVENVSKEITTTVASMRLDAIMSSGFGIAREKSASLISMEKVSLNYKVVTNQKKLLREGDLISVRGYGRLEVMQVLGETRKDRIRVILNRK